MRQVTREEWRLFVKGYPMSKLKMDLYPFDPPADICQDLDKGDWPENIVAAIQCYSAVDPEKPDEFFIAD